MVELFEGATVTIMASGFRSETAQPISDGLMSPESQSTVTVGLPTSFRLQFLLFPALKDVSVVLGAVLVVAGVGWW
ncbi:hypothetical protein Hanom_Chr14g01308291 [Helianthus anomalus]